MRPYWDRYYQVFQAIIFVIKSTASDEEMEMAKQELYKALKHPQLKALPLLVLANFSDLEGARSAQDVSAPWRQDQHLCCQSSGLVYFH